MEKSFKFRGIEGHQTESSLLSEKDSQSISYYKSSTKRQPHGSYEVRIPIKENFVEQLFEGSKHTIISKYHQLEQKPQRNSNLETKCKSVRMNT